MTSLNPRFARLNDDITRFTWVDLNSHHNMTEFWCRSRIFLFPKIISTDHFFKNLFGFDLICQNALVSQT